MIILKRCLCIFVWRRVCECTVVFASINQQVLIVCDEKGLVVTSGQGSDSILIVNQSNLTLVGICSRQAWLNRCCNVGLWAIKQHIFRDDFDKVICWTESTIWFLDQTSKHVRDVVINFVATFQLFSFLFHCAYGMMTSSWQLFLRNFTMWLLEVNMTLLCCQYLTLLSQHSFNNMWLRWSHTLCVVSSNTIASWTVLWHCDLYLLGLRWIFLAYLAILNPVTTR